MSTASLHLVSVDDLLAELHRRHDASVFIGWRDRGEHICDHILDWAGGAIPCLGLVASANDDLLVRLREKREPK